MARIARPRWQPLLVALILTPLWASYLVKVYAWRLVDCPPPPYPRWDRGGCDSCCEDTRVTNHVAVGKIKDDDIILS